MFYSDNPALNNVVFAGYLNELSKLAGVPGKPAARKAIIKGRDLASGAIGAGTLYSGNRLVQDIKDGEAVRKQRKEQARMGY